MRHWALLTLIALAPLLALGQVVVTPSGWATMGGPAIPVAQAGPAQLLAPIVNLGTTSPSPVGATNATANNVAGADNATIGNVPPVANATETQVQYVTPYPTVVGAGGEYTPVIPSAEVPGPRPASSPSAMRLGAAQFNSAYNIGTRQPDVSLGEIAREWQRKKAALNARAYTNQDINRLEQQSGTPAGGISATAVSAGAATGTAPGAPPPAAAAQPQTSTPLPQQQAMAQSQPPMQPTEQAQPVKAPGHTARELPHTASPLPALLLLGLAAGTVGFVARRRQRAK